MRRLFARTALSVLIGAGFCVTLAAQPVGHVVYLRGDPSAVRGARRLWLGIGLGMPLQPFDFFQTGDDELIEIETSAETGVRAMLRVQPRTVLYLDLRTGAAQPTQSVRLLSGSVSVRMRDADPRARLQVVTAGPHVSAAGADYDVTVSVTGAVLVTAAHGTVGVRDSGGRMLYADAERAVEHRADGTFRSVPVSVTRTDRFRSIWRGQVESDFTTDALDTYRRYADRYLDQLPRFQSAYRELMDQRHILDRWMEDDRQGRTPRRRGTPAEILAAEVRELRRELEAARTALESIEDTWYRLRELSRFAAGGVGPLDAAAGERLTVAEFFQRLTADARILEQQMHTVRYAVRLHAARSAAAQEDAGRTEDNGPAGEGRNTPDSSSSTLIASARIADIVPAAVSIPLRSSSKPG